MPRIAACVLLSIAVAGAAAQNPSRGAFPLRSAPETLEAVGALPAHLTVQFEDPIGFVQSKGGEYFVLDRRGHSVYAVNTKQTSMRRVLHIGFEQGKVLEPGAFGVSSDDIFAVSDAPYGRERIQYFGLDGLFLGGFYLESRVAPRVVAGSLILNGVGSMHFAGKTFLVNRPETGALISEFDIQGKPLRQIGALRPTGHESDKEVHLALNTGMALPDPAGGFYFVFQTGIPMLRKYDASGRFVFERHIEGPELDADIQKLPTVWPRRSAATALGAIVYPVVDLMVRTAAVDPDGRLWISLKAPFTYVYDANGEKRRTLQFHAAGIVSPASLAFAKGDRVLVTPGCYEFSAK